MHPCTRGRKWSGKGSGVRLERRAPEEHQDGSFDRGIGPLQARARPGVSGDSQSCTIWLRARKRRTSPQAGSQRSP